MDAIRINELEAGPEELARRRKLANARRERENERKAFISRLMHSIREAEQLRAWLEQQTDQNGNPDLTRMLDWARNQLAAMVRDTDPAQIAEQLRKKQSVSEHR